MSKPIHLSGPAWIGYELGLGQANSDCHLVTLAQQQKSQLEVSKGRTENSRSHGC